MIRDHVGSRLVSPEPDFHWRGGEITRVESLTDAVFAFAVTLIVVSLEVPKTFDELVIAMKGFVAFAVCFGVLLRLWYSHFIYSRRYGLQTAYSVVLNAILLFVVLFYVYPLKFLFTLTTRGFVGMAAEPSRPPITIDQVPGMMVLFSVGFVAVFGVLALMYRYAYGNRVALQLNEYEALRTRHDMMAYTAVAMGGALVAVAAEVLPARQSFFSIFLALVGVIYRALTRGRHLHAERRALERGVQHGRQ